MPAKATVSALGAHAAEILGSSAELTPRSHTASEFTNTLEATQYDTPADQGSSCCSSSLLWDWPEIHTGPAWHFKKQAMRIDVHAKDTMEEVFGALWRQTHLQTELVLFEFGAQEQPILAHRSILALKSAVFKRMLECESFSEAKSGRIRIRDCPRDRFQSFIAYIYGQEAGGQCDGRSIWELADKYGVGCLKDMLLGTIDETNVAAAAQYGYDAGSDEVMMAAAMAAGECLPRIGGESLEGVRMEVALSLMAAYRPGGLPCYLFVERWYAANKAIGDADTLIRSIDYGKVSLKDLVGRVKGGGLMAEPLFAEIYECKIQRISTHPWAMQKIDPTFNVGCRGMSPGLFENPVGAAVSPDGGFVIADRDNQRIQIFAGDGRLVSSFGVGGYGDSEFLVPVGVACDMLGRIYVADSAQHKVKVFGRDGRFIGSFGAEGQGQGQLLVPVDVAVCDSTGHIAVCEYHNSRVSVFSSDYSFLYTVGKGHGGDPGEFRHPSGVAFSAEGLLVVADQGNYRIQLFSGERFVRCFGGRGSSLGQFELITSVAVGPNGDYVVSDVGHRQVFLFTHDGAFAQVLGPNTSPPRHLGSPYRDRASGAQNASDPRSVDGKFVAPEGVAVGRGGTVLVVDGGAHNFHVYETFA